MYKTKNIMIDVECFNTELETENFGYLHNLSKRKKLTDLIEVCFK